MNLSLWSLNLAISNSYLSEYIRIYLTMTHKFRSSHLFLRTSIASISRNVELEFAFFLFIHEWNSSGRFWCLINNGCSFLWITIGFTWLKRWHKDPRIAQFFLHSWDLFRGWCEEKAKLCITVPYEFHGSIFRSSLAEHFERYRYQLRFLRCAEYQMSLSRGPWLGLKAIL